MKFITYAITAFLTTFAVVADQSFYLVNDNTQEEIGPLTFTNDAPVKIGESIYRIHQSNDKATETEAYMRRVIIPSLEFRYASLTDVLNFLLYSGRGGINEPRLNIVSDNNDSSIDTNPKIISLDLSGVSLYDALEIVCEKTDMEFTIDVNGIVRVRNKSENSDGQHAPPAGRGEAPRP